ncbi:MAG: DnaJ domain-containing protein [Candidatus Melainabacteria bacterium]|jgi:DnaJ-class molecular chaperone|nr:DnaJ domain-containing protein [Candidatus Melainabacteria bacterium]
MDFKDYYKMLGINKDSDEKEVKSAFKKLAKQHHPDASTGSEEQFKKINEAYEVLKDKNKKSRYDYIYSNMKQTNPFDSKSQTFKQQKMYSNYNSFADFYKQKEQELREKQTKDKGQKQEKRTRTSSSNSKENKSDFFEMFFGKQKEEANKTNGSKSQANKESQAKPSKGEDFEMLIDLSLEDAYHGCMRKIEITVSSKNVRRLEVSIPPGVRNGTRIKVASEGKPGEHGGAAGDLYLLVRLTEHEQFWLDEDDVHSELTIEPQDAVLGCTKKIPTLEEIVEVVIPADTHNGRILRLRQKGLKNSQGEILGDHYIHIIIDIPSKLSPEEIKSYEYLRELSNKR